MTHPYFYQRQAAARIEMLGGRALLADEPGLGKTLEALLWRRRTPEASPTVVVCPAGLKFHWEREASLHMGVRAEVLEGRKAWQASLTRPELIVINYDILGPWMEYLNSVRPKLIILDEAHYASNRQAQRTKFAKELCRGVPYVLALTGTPLTNRPAELYPILNILRPDLFPAFYPFAERYCNPTLKPWGWDYSGAVRLDELHQFLTDNVMIRRLKKDVLHELPAKQRFVIPMPMSKPEEYLKATRDFFGWLSQAAPGKVRGAMRSEALVKVGYLKRLAAQLKMTAVYEWVDNFLAVSDEKLLVFGVHKAILHGLKDRYPSSVIIDGEVTGRARQHAVDSFNNLSSCRLCFANIVAGGVGWSCKARQTAFVEMAWTPGAHSQAEDRCHGLNRGKAGMHSQAYYLVAHGTIEEKLCQLIQSKQKVLDAVLDGRSDASDFNLFDQLMDEIMKERAA